MRNRCAVLAHHVAVFQNDAENLESQKALETAIANSSDNDWLPSIIMHNGNQLPNKIAIPLLLAIVISYSRFPENEAIFTLAQAALEKAPPFALTIPITTGPNKGDTAFQELACLLTQVNNAKYKVLFDIALQKAPKEIWGKALEGRYTVAGTKNCDDCALCELIFALYHSPEDADIQRFVAHAIEHTKPIHWGIALENMQGKGNNVLLKLIAVFCNTPENEQLQAFVQQLIQKLPLNTWVITVTTTDGKKINSLTQLLPLITINLNNPGFSKMLQLFLEKISPEMWCTVTKTYNKKANTPQRFLFSIHLAEKIKAATQEKIQLPHPETLFSVLLSTVCQSYRDSLFLNLFATACEQIPTDYLETPIQFPSDQPEKSVVRILLETFEKHMGTTNTYIQTALSHIFKLLNRYLDKIEPNKWELICDENLPNDFTIYWVMFAKNPTTQTMAKKTIEKLSQQQLRTVNDFLQENIVENNNSDDSINQLLKIIQKKLPSKKSGTITPKKQKNNTAPKPSEKQAEIEIKPISILVPATATATASAEPAYIVDGEIDLLTLCEHISEHPDDSDALLALQQKNAQDDDTIAWFSPGCDGEHTVNPCSYLIKQLFKNWERLYRNLLTPLNEILEKQTLTQWPTSPIPALIQTSDWASFTEENETNNGNRVLPSSLQQLALLFEQHVTSPELLKIMLVAKKNAPLEYWQETTEFYPRSALTIVKNKLEQLPRKGLLTQPAYQELFKFVTQNNGHNSQKFFQATKPRTQERPETVRNALNQAE